MTYNISLRGQTFGTYSETDKRRAAALAKSLLINEPGATECVVTDADGHLTACYFRSGNDSRKVYKGGAHMYVKHCN